jgi:thioredoxin reductase (NADPH)
VQRKCKVDKAYRCKSIIIATGTVNRKLGIDRENELVGKGVSYCATCDGAFYRGKDVAVVGGGSTALEDAAFLSNYCNKVYLIHRRNEFRGEDTLVKTLESKENVEFVLSSKVVKLEGELRLESIGIEYIEGTNDVKKLTEEDINGLNKKESGLQAAEIQDTQTKVRSTDVAGLFIAIGQVPSNEIFKDVIDLDEYGYIVATENCKTNIDGIFVAGDCRTKKVRQLTTAASDGAIAGLAACEYIG